MERERHKEALTPSLDTHTQKALETNHAYNQHLHVAERNTVKLKSSHSIVQRFIALSQRCWNGKYFAVVRILDEHTIDLYRFIKFTFAMSTKMVFSTVYEPTKTSKIDTFLLLHKYQNAKPIVSGTF